MPKLIRNEWCVETQEICKVYTELKRSKPVDENPLPRAKHDHHQKAIGVGSLQMLTRLLTLVQVGDCREYALRGNNKVVIIIFLVYDNSLFFMLELY